MRVIAQSQACNPVLVHQASTPRRGAPGEDGGGDRLPSKLSPSWFQGLELVPVNRYAIHTSRFDVESEYIGDQRIWKGMAPTRRSKFRWKDTSVHAAISVVNADTR